MNDPKFPHGTPNQGFMIEAKGTASPEAQVKYLQVLLRVKEDRIKTLELQLETQRLESALAIKQAEKRIETLFEINLDLRRSQPIPEVPMEYWAWIDWKKLPWWRRLFRREI